MTPARPPDSVQNGSPSTGEPSAREPSGEAHGDRERDGAESRRIQVDVEPAGEDRGLDHQAGRVEAVEPGEDQHQAHEGHVRVVRSEGPGAALHVELADPRPEVEEHAQSERARDAVDDERGDRVVEAELRDEPAAGAPAPGRVRDPDRRAEQDGQEQVGGEPDALDEGAGHDRAGRPGEEQEGEEEDGADVILEVRPHRRRPGRGRAAEAREGLGARVAVQRVRPDGGEAGLEAAVDVPAEVVEGRCHDGDREDVLHRRRHDVLASRGARLVGHEAGVDQPHDHDGEEVELLRQDQRVEADLGLKLLHGRGLGEQRSERRHQLALLDTHAIKAPATPNPRQTYETSRTWPRYDFPTFSGCEVSPADI